MQCGHAEQLFLSLVCLCWCARDSCRQLRAAATAFGERQQAYMSVHVWQLQLGQYRATATASGW